MEIAPLDPRLRLIQDADVKDKVVLVRVDHNVVKKGRIHDAYRVEATLGTIYSIVEKGGRPILMTHVDRPRDKRTGHIDCGEGRSVRPTVEYLSEKLSVRIHVPDFPTHPERGILHLDETIRPALDQLRRREIGMIYLPNTRWFQGEESKGPERDTFAEELAGIADIFVNDAFGSWQPHASTYDVARKLPAFAGLTLQKELQHLGLVLKPRHPFLAIIAGAKYDTKIGPLRELYEKVDHLILGGLMYNTFLAAQTGAQIAGVDAEDLELARDLVAADARVGKILAMPLLVESDTLGGRVAGQYRTLDTKGLKRGHKVNYLLDVAPESFAAPAVKEIVGGAGAIFVNAVMGLMPHFPEGSRQLFRLVISNAGAIKLFAGGDTLQELRNLCPGLYLNGLDDPQTYFFTGGGSVLTAIGLGSPYRMKPIEVLMNPS